MQQTRMVSMNLCRLARVFLAVSEVRVAGVPGRPQPAAGRKKHG
ncbi:MAG TPA: hypothetical protein PLN94_01740 [Thiolinea sp.]|nr:hypothetical protein [Thiolinea sp.]